MTTFQLHEKEVQSIYYKIKPNTKMKMHSNNSAIFALSQDASPLLIESFLGLEAFMIDVWQLLMMKFFFLKFTAFAVELLLHQYVAFLNVLTFIL